MLRDDWAGGPCIHRPLNTVLRKCSHVRTHGCIDARHVLEVARVRRAQDAHHADCVLIARLRDLHAAFPISGRADNQFHVTAAFPISGRTDNQFHVTKVLVEACNLGEKRSACRLSHLRVHRQSSYM